MTAETARAKLMRRNEKIEEAPLQGELMLFDPAAAKFFVLNETMAFVWRHCDGKVSLAEIARSLTEEYSGVVEEIALQDVERSANELVVLGLLLD
ncbi:MAG: hypothetical protein QOI24_1322 [Acidobacteriota bacterium]|jgi:hypothetical protein|nr:hypothetical protein [Acidobacteriota bacterium]